MREGVTSRAGKGRVGKEGEGRQTNVDDILQPEKKQKKYWCFPVSHQDNSRLDLELPVVIYDYFVLVGFLCCFACLCWIH